MVEPMYKEPWEIPGVVIEALESPLSTVVRELQEELGIRFHASEFSLISVDYLRETDDQTEALMLLFNGPLFDEQRISSFPFVNPEDAHTKLGPIVGARALRTCEALRTGLPVYWEDEEVG
jgi:ADP-ribose pyrophosphatase YjhB (NUDIX family)